MPDTLQTPANAQGAAPSTVTEKERLLAEVVVLQARAKAIKSLIDEKKARLLLLMQGDGDMKRKTPEGTASRQGKRKFVIYDRSKLKTLFSEDVLMEQVKVTAEFYDAAKKAEVEIDDAVTVESDEQFKVEGARTKEAKERQERIMEETRIEMERRVETLAMRMIEAKRANPDG